ncbi:hypothetical protein Bpfe_001538, partial [Biomphalaria pfeifferi]
WIGANDINKESNFIWSSDNSSFLNSTWMLSQPDDNGNNEDCVEIRTDRESKYTNDNKCTARSHHLCQI